MSDNETKPADIVALLVSPVLIMALVGSLVFFLLEVLYAGAHPGRLQWVLFFFVFGSVLIARISMDEDISARSYLYGLTLAGLSFGAMQMYVDYPAHLASLSWSINLGLVALTWWSAHRLTWDCTFLDDKVGASGEGVLQAAGLEEKDTTSIQRYRKRKKDDEPKRTPGVWVIWFSLAALPLYGLGQALIPPDESRRRLYTFWLMVIYVSSGLGLLLTTSFLGLRLYLDRRNLRMPLAMTTVWLTFGLLLVASLLGLGAVLPRPASELKVIDLDPVGADPAQAKKKKEEREGRFKESRGEDGRGEPEKDQPRRNNDKEEQGSGSKQEDGDQGKGDRQGEKDSSSQSPGNSTPNWWEKLLPILKIVVFILFGLIVLFIAVRAILRFSAGFSTWARNLLRFFESLWASFLSLFRRPDTTETTESDAPEPVPPRPFETFSNPFADGRAGSMSPEELVRYTFAALEAWAHDRRLGRRRGETALELAVRLGDELPALEVDMKRLAHLFAMMVYGRGGLPSGATEVLNRVWQGLDEKASRPLAAV